MRGLHILEMLGLSLWIGSERCRKMAPKKSGMSAAAIEELITQQVIEALVAQDTNRNSGNRLSHWFEKMEFVFHISNYTVKCQVKYATCTLLGGALIWWNFHVRYVGHDAVYRMPWKTLMKMMTENYCPRSEIKKLKTELWNLTMKGTDVESYTQRFQELVLLCSRMIPDEADKVERYVGGLLVNIQGSVMASKPKILQEVIEFARRLMDQKVRVYAARQANNKRRMDNNPRDNHAQQPPYKRQNVARAYTVRPGEKKEYARTLPLSPAATNTQRAPGAVQKTVTCFECRNQEHYKKDCLKLKNTNRGNQTGNSEARGRAYALGRGKPNPDSNVVTVADALSRKERIKRKRVRALVMTIGLNLPVQILNAQAEARKAEYIKAEDLGGMIKKLEPRSDRTLCLKNKS
ncbi:reverse transcriptase domain-containing protein [Tanacetum coccineum]